MNRVHFILLTITLSLGLALSVCAQTHDETLTNASIIKLVQAGFKEKTIITIIHSRPNRFELAPEQLIELKKKGVSENVILAMLSQEQSIVDDSDDWGNDSAFLRGMKRSDPRGGGSPSGGTDIFGSGGSSQSHTQGRGANGSNEGGTYTTGSATVRILRPPTEGGSSSATLEKTPTLNNDSIIHLVEAGFSEGTIIKRIEDSPAEFDLSAAKLTELKKHRVTDPIIAAMKAAMEDEGAPRSERTRKSGEN